MEFLIWFQKSFGGRGRPKYRDRGILTFLKLNAKLHSFAFFQGKDPKLLRIYKWTTVPPKGKKMAWRIRLNPQERNTGS